MAGRFAIGYASLVLAVGVGVTRDAHAGCNAIPDAESITGANRGVPGLIGFKGALGRIDRLYFVPDGSASFRVQADGICVNRAPGAAPIVRPVSADVRAENYVVSLLVQPATGPAIARILGTEKSCTPFTAYGQATQNALFRMACDPTPARVERDGNMLNVRIPVPGQNALFGGSPNSPEPMSGTLTAIVTSMPADVATHAALLERVRADGCAAHCAELLDAGALACVDKIYRLTSTGTFDTDPIPCSVGVASTAKNNFQEQCENAQSGSGLPSCNDHPTQLAFWQDACGGIHIPFDWTGIRRHTPGPEVTRLVAGLSGTAVGKGLHRRGWIPGREFLGSTPYGDPEGKAPSTDWRFPEIDVWYPDEPSQVVGLRGSTDQDDSIVHVFPRMPVSIACDGVAGDEACMAVDGRIRGSGISCACTDRYPAGCRCKQLASPRFFACNGGEFEGMPCTRHAHCNGAGGKPSGKCSGQPSCKPTKEAGVWIPGRGHTAGKKCWDDAACGPNHQCGYRLFNLDHLQDNGVIVLDAQIEDTLGARQRRGACKKNPKRSCSNITGNQKACPENEKPCRGYVLIAEGQSGGVATPAPAP